MSCSDPPVAPSCQRWRLVERRGYGDDVPGAVAIVLILLLLPVVVCMSFAFIAGALGQLLAKDGEARNEGSELVDLNV